MSFVTFCRYSFFSSILLFSFPASAKSAKQQDFFSDCPVAHDIRISDPAVANRYSALANCSGQLVEGAVVPLPERPPIMRIMGVSDEADDAQKKRSRRDRRKNAPAVATAAGSFGARPYALEIEQAAMMHRIDPLFLHAVIEAESAYGPKRISRAGAVGLMQIMPATGAMLGVTSDGLLEPATNIDAGSRYLKQLQRRYGRDFELILGAYNAGPGAVARHGNRIPPYRETQAYVRKVIGLYGALRQEQVAASGTPQR